LPKIRDGSDRSSYLPSVRVEKRHSGGPGNALTIEELAILEHQAIEHSLSLLHNDRDFTAMATVIPKLKLTKF
jgi:predicted nucleic acid-binding protein